MKIELSPVPVDKDVASRSPRDEAARGVSGDAFDRAIRNAAPKSKKTEADPKAPNETAAETKGRTEDEETAATFEPSSETPAESGGEPATTAAQPDARGLQALLTRLAGSAPTSEGERPDTDALASRAPAARLVVDVTVDADALSTEGEGAPAKGVRLEVLHMETHFEPRQDGMVLVETPDAAKTNANALADGLRGLAALSKSASEAGVLQSTLSSSTRTGAGDASGAPIQDEGGDAIRLRFDEALARLGQPAEGRGGGEGASRDGSSSSRSAMSELNARRTEIRSPGALDVGFALSAASDAMGLTGQVAGRIVDALGDPSSSPTPSFAPSGETHLRMRAGGAALKTLTIQLQPEHLGTLNVSMRLSEGKLALEISASQSDTAALLLEDRGTLRKLLEHAGFALDDAAITVVTRDTQTSVAKGSDASGSGAASREGSPGSQQRGTEGDGRSSPGSSGGEPDRRPRAQRGGEDIGDRKLVATYL